MQCFCIRSLSHAFRCLATAEGIPYASFLHPLSLTCRPVSRRRQLKAYPLRFCCIGSLSHAVRFLATAEGIPYAAFLHPLSLACRPVSRDS